MRIPYLVLGLLVAGQTLHAGCAATARRGEPIAGEVDLRNPQLAAGKAVFDRNCAQCHPGGAGGLAPEINNKPLPGFMIRLQVRAGCGAMPAFPVSRISDRELDDMVAYVMALRALKPNPADLERPAGGSRAE